MNDRARADIKFVGRAMIYGAIYGALAVGSLGILWLGIKYAYGSMDKPRQRQVTRLTDRIIDRVGGEPVIQTEARKKVAVKRRKYSAKKPAGSTRPHQTKPKD